MKKLTVLLLTLVICLSAFSLMACNEAPAAAGPTIESIAVNAEYAQKEFLLGDNFNDMGIAVTAKMSDGTYRALTRDEYVVDATAFYTNKASNGIGQRSIKVYPVANANNVSSIYYVDIVDYAVSLTAIDSTEKYVQNVTKFDPATISVFAVTATGNKVKLTMDTDYTVDAKNLKLDENGIIKANRTQNVVIKAVDGLELNRKGELLQCNVTIAISAS